MSRLNSLLGPDDSADTELSPSERRALVRRIADLVGTEISARVQDASESGRPLSTESERVAAASEIQRALANENERRLRDGLLRLSDTLHQSLFDGVMAHAYGLGELDVLWHNPEVENINANGPNDVFVTLAGGKKIRWSPIAESQEAMIDLIRRAARRLGLVEVEFDARHPHLDLQLPDGSRLYAVYGGTQVNGVSTQPLLAIRRHRFLDITIDDTVRMGVWPKQAADFVRHAFVAGFNVVIAGDWGSGKTTLLRALCLDAIAPHERVITVEKGLTELGLHHCPERLPNVAALFSRPASAEGDGEVTVWDQIQGPSRRLDPTRVIVGEVLGEEVGPALDVFAGSTRGSACTLHARSANGVVNRFVYLGHSARPPVPAEAVRHALAEAAPIIVHLEADDSVEGSIRRFCTSIVEVNGIEGDHLSTTELWSLDADEELVAVNAPSAENRRRLARRGWIWERDGWAHSLGSTR
jgi:Flp pilus assembly CpaF family ATPase